MAFTSNQPQASGQEEAQLANYRTVSVAAILALVLGLASALALAHWLLWIVPVLAIVMAIVALRHIHTEGSNLTGHNLAILGIFLALLFGLWAPAQIVSRQNHLYRQARQYSDEWLELLHSGRILEAHQLSMQESDRQTPGTDLPPYYESSTDTAKDLEGFRNRDAIKKLLALGDKANYEFLGGGGIPSAESGTQIVRLNYVAHWTEHGKERQFPFRVALARRHDSKSRDYLWHIEGIGDLTKEN